MIARVQPVVSEVDDLYTGFTKSAFLRTVDLGEQRSTRTSGCVRLAEWPLLNVSGETVADAGN